MTAIRFFHVADLHLDSPFKGVTSMPDTQLKALRDSTFEAFQTIVQTAVKEKPDFILIVGDIYDGEDRSLRAQHKFQQGMETLHKHQIPVFLCHGNHDHLGGKWTRFQLPPNVHVFQSKTEKVQVNIRQQDVYITGFSYIERHVKESMMSSYEAASQADAFHIGMLHGSLAGDETHAVYAPFTKEDLLSKNYDYWALGHIHKRQMLHAEPPIVYSGNIQSRHRNEKGPKGFYDVTLDKSGAQLNFVPTSAIIYEQIECSCKDIVHANEWIEMVEESIERFRSKFGAGILEIKLIDVDINTSTMLNGTTIEEWVALIRETQEMKVPTIWVQSISVDIPETIESGSSGLTDQVISVMSDWDAQDWKEIISDVYQHSRSSRFMEKLTVEEYEAIERDARAIIQKELLIKE
ncbi:metallophosphoesterase family protein [Paenisporosarcina indica]|uniref:metallophosphoesterase family protein n=1 Tax=Paenisporosarcina indica TaxID=650093 RepID=UPI00094FA8BF|nr:DNA repair exonuclease [Paenisporosarcina indica]